MIRKRHKQRFSRCILFFVCSQRCCAAPYTRRSYPFLLHLITLLLRYALQYYSFVGKGVKREKEGYYLYIIYIYIIYIIVNIFTFIFAIFQASLRMMGS